MEIIKIGTAVLNLSLAFLALWQVQHASAQSIEPKRLGTAEDLVRKHTERMLDKLPQFMNYGENVAAEGIADSTASTVFEIQGPRSHPWKSFGNPGAQTDYFLDSLFNLDARPVNSQNWSQAWSCFEPKLLAKAHDGKSLVDVSGPENEDLIAECRSKCVNRMQHIPFERGSITGAMLYRAFGCSGDSDPWGYLENGYEVVEFWFPEYQVSINNYGINRIRPEILSPTGQQFTRSALLGQKQGTPEQQIRSGVEQSYPLSLAAAQLLEPREDPYLGQGVWGGPGMSDTQDKAYGHVVRTWLSVNAGEKQKKTTDGWEVNPEFSLYDALPKPRREHDPANIWTEYGMFDVITSIPHLSYRIRPDIMQALQGPQEKYTTAAVKEKPFWQSKGAAAYRSKRWPKEFAPLSEVFEIRGNSSAALKEAVYKGGHELFPLVTNLSGFGTPALSTAAILTRRTLYLAGSRAPMNLGGDASGSVASYFPQGAERGRIITYTINERDKSREIDKMQLISPKRPKEASRHGGSPPTVAECLRSQNIPNLVNADPKLEQWAQKFMPSHLVGYYSDRDFFSLQGGDITFTYWNRRIGCFCDRCGLPTGSSEIANGGDGDKLYDRERFAYCRYPLVTPWNAWAKEDTFEKCRSNGLNEGFYDGTGIRDQT